MLWDTDPETRAEMEALVTAGDSEILSGRLLKRIRFGTAGTARDAVHSDVVCCPT